MNTNQTETAEQSSGAAIGSLPEVTRYGLMDMQVCVPKDWSDEQVLAFAEQKFPCNTANGWRIRKKGDELLAGCDERVQCADRSDCVHVVLDA